MFTKSPPLILFLQQKRIDDALTHTRPKLPATAVQRPSVSSIFLVIVIIVIVANDMM